MSVKERIKFVRKLHELEDERKKVKDHLNDIWRKLNDILVDVNETQERIQALIERANNLDLEIEREERKQERESLKK